MVLPRRLRDADLRGTRARRAPWWAPGRRAGPSRAGGVVGFFVNTLVLRADLPGAQFPRRFSRRVRERNAGRVRPPGPAVRAAGEAPPPERDLAHTRCSRSVPARRAPRRPSSRPRRRPPGRPETSSRAPHRRSSTSPSSCGPPRRASTARRVRHRPLRRAPAAASCSAHFECAARERPWRDPPDAPRRLSDRCSPPRERRRSRRVDLRRRPPPPIRPSTGSSRDRPGRARGPRGRSTGETR